jgi:hypothetical protein
MQDYETWIDRNLEWHEIIFFIEIVLDNTCYTTGVGHFQVLGFSPLKVFLTTLVTTFNRCRPVIGLISPLQLVWM